MVHNDGPLSIDLVISYDRSHTAVHAHMVFPIWSLFSEIDKIFNSKFDSNKSYNLYAYQLESIL